MLLSNPDQLSLLKQNNPRLTEALEKGLEEFTRVLREQQNERAEQERLRIRMLQADPFDSQAQTLIAEEIRKQNIDSNMETAMEYHPEAYGQVTMLYIDCKVEGNLIKAFVDSGAQSTIMSKSCAERCNITRLIDARWSGIAKGVGTQRIIGRIHLTQVQIENDFLASSFTILEDQTMDMLLGLDMLKRHQCSIDLRRNVLVIGTTGTETRFLSESEIPEHAKNSRNPAEEGDAELAEAMSRSVTETSANPTPQTSGPSASSHPEPVVKELMNLGFSREQVLHELNRFNGNRDEAVAALLAKSLVFPR
jgi:DNA damage-inducible protein 1